MSRVFIFTPEAAGLLVDLYGSLLIVLAVLKGVSKRRTADETTG